MPGGRFVDPGAGPEAGPQRRPGRTPRMLPRITLLCVTLLLATVAAFRPLVSKAPNHPLRTDTKRMVRASRRTAPPGRRRGLLEQSG